MKKFLITIFISTVGLFGATYPDAFVKYEKQRVLQEHYDTYKDHYENKKHTYKNHYKNNTYKSHYSNHKYNQRNYNKELYSKSVEFMITGGHVYSGGKISNLYNQSFKVYKNKFTKYQLKGEDGYSKNIYVRLDNDSRIILYFGYINSDDGYVFDYVSSGQIGNLTYAGKTRIYNLEFSMFGN